MGHYGIAHARKLIVLSRARAPATLYGAGLRMRVFILSSRECERKPKLESVRGCVREREREGERRVCVHDFFRIYERT